MEQKDELVQEFNDHKANKTQGLRISVKSRVNDVNHTLDSIATEVSMDVDIAACLTIRMQLSNLQARTGVEALVFITRGSTDFPMRGVSFATRGVEEFLETGLKMDVQDFISKMEGFSLRGVQGNRGMDLFCGITLLICAFQGWLKITNNAYLPCAQIFGMKYNKVYVRIPSFCATGHSLYSSLHRRHHWRPKSKNAMEIVLEECRQAVQSFD